MGKRYHDDTTWKGEVHFIQEGEDGTMVPVKRQSKLIKRAYAIRAKKPHGPPIFHVAAKSRGAWLSGFVGRRLVLN
jgi:hypothetical protein